MGLQHQYMANTVAQLRCLEYFWATSARYRQRKNGAITTGTQRQNGRTAEQQKGRTAGRRTAERQNGRKAERQNGRTAKRKKKKMALCSLERKHQKKCGNAKM